jgi:hypothetical protein
MLSRRLHRTINVRRSLQAGTRLLNTAPSDESLIPITLKEMAENSGDSEGVETTAASLRAMGQKRLTLEEKKKRRRALDAIGVPEFNSFLAERGLLTKGEELPRRATTMLQVNVGLYCNQACNHCHVESSPKRTETMSDETVARVLQVLAASPSIETLDITGGAPEMNSAFKPLVIGATKLGVEVIDRCNLTVMVEPSMQWLGPFLKEHKVRIVGEPPRARSCACAALAALPTALFGRTAPSNPRPSPRCAPRYAPRSHGTLEPSADALCGAPSRAQPRYRATRSAMSTRSVAARSSNARSKASSA